MKPLAFVRTVTPPILAVFRPSAVAAAAPEADVPLPAAALLAGALLGALLDELLVELHAASAARPAAAGSTSSARPRRLGTFSLSCDVIMYFPPFSRWLSAFLPGLRRALSRAETTRRVSLALDGPGAFRLPCGAGGGLCAALTSCRRAPKAAMTARSDVPRPSSLMRSPRKPLAKPRADLGPSQTRKSVISNGPRPPPPPPAASPQREGVTGKSSPRTRHPFSASWPWKRRRRGGLRGEIAWLSRMRDRDSLVPADVHGQSAD